MRRAACVAGFAAGCFVASVLGALAALSWMSEHFVPVLGEDGDPEPDGWGWGEPFVSWGQAEDD